MKIYILLSVFFVLIYFSIKLRVVNRRNVSDYYEYEPKDTPLSRSIVELISIAGGIYIALTLALSFLKIDYAPMYRLLEVEFDFLAALSIVLASVQPVFTFIGSKLKLK
ncbi:hypothetical protein HYG86_11150 [Alkalicella caledoniensis]|uniref:Uncharacterized protein n=1 Tax=Alkalicella caledoniensis TaxID=2731377 RepID=A0A7G9W9B7_ALKCA|nr:hypothetical protein [Alkalicella caledoniensis]QNO15279.1 hypothetical protein HYG86_11150 [Alkalicella caledoniensis]